MGKTGWPRTWARLASGWNLEKGSTSKIAAGEATEMRHFYKIWRTPARRTAAIRSKMLLLLLLLPVPTYPDVELKVVKPACPMLRTITAGTRSASGIPRLLWWRWAIWSNASANSAAGSMFWMNLTKASEAAGGDWQVITYDAGRNSQKPYILYIRPAFLTFKVNLDGWVFSSSFFHCLLGSSARKS